MDRFSDCRCIALSNSTWANRRDGEQQQLLVRTGYRARPARPAGQHGVAVWGAQHHPAGHLRQRRRPSAAAAAGAWRSGRVRARAWRAARRARRTSPWRMNISATSTSGSSSSERRVGRRAGSDLVHQLVPVGVPGHVVLAAVAVRPAKKGMRMPGAASRRYSRIIRWAARSRVFQPSHRVGASGPAARRVRRGRRVRVEQLTPEFPSVLGGGFLMAWRRC